MIYGILNLSFWGDVLVGLCFTQVTIAAVTLYLHRSQAHRSLDFHPVVSHFFRLWLWLTTGMLTHEWVAIHRKHHASTDIEGDPHSPKLYGIRRVLWEGAELYRASTKDKAMIEKYSHGTPNDWVERHVYSRYPVLGVSMMLVLNLILFGIPGISLWAVQMLWIPFHAAGVINGIGHYFGYRNFESQDVSRNIIPWAFWIGGEELHNNHHAFASSAKFSIRWYEFDIGWLYIRCLAFLGLAKVKKVAPRLIRDSNKHQIDLDTVKAVVANRFQVMSEYYHRVICPVVRAEERLTALQPDYKRLLRSSARLLARSDRAMSDEACTKRQLILSKFERLKTVYQFGTTLQNIWLKTASSQKDIVDALQQWCKQAEASGLEVLQQFSAQLKQVVPQQQA
jgi:stearoyl-CoA desaturase (delta-9 desaturase)